MNSLNIARHYTRGEFGLSFEVFPPKTEPGMDALWRNIGELMRFRPAFMTCTYGAGGSTRDKTLDIAARMHADHHIPVAAHLTCVGSTVDELRAYLAEAQRRDINYIVALRGDPPQGEAQFRAVEGGLRYANELVALIRAEFPEFGIAVAGYPETHREASSANNDMENLKRKVDAGGQCVITQLFYTNADFFRFREACEKAGITVPIVPGILPVTSAGQLQRVVTNCGANLPQALFDRMQAQQFDEAAQFQIGIDHVTKQSQELIDQKAPGLHFYVLNKSEATATILSALKLDRDGAV